MFKRGLSIIMCMILAIGSCLTLSIPANAEYVSYSGSSSYMSGKYYQQLTAVNLTGNQADDIVNVALSQVGYHEGSKSEDLSGTSSGKADFTEYGRVMGSNPNAWCAYFASWCARRANVGADVIHGFSGCTSAVVNFKSGSWNNAGVWHDGYILNHNTTYVPQKGDLVFYDWEKSFYYNSPSDYLDGGVNHVGIVWKDSTSANMVYVVEGNTSDCNVAKKTIGLNRSKTEVVGYFSPAYTGGSSNYNTFSITSPSDMQYLDPRTPGSVTWNAFPGAKSYSYTVREVQYNSSTGKYDDTGTYLCTRVCTTEKSFSLNKDENSNLSGYVKNWGAYKIWVGACSDTSGRTVIADQIIYVCLNHLAKTPDLKKPFASSKTQIMSNLYTDTYSGTVSPDQDLTISWSSEGQSYDYSIKALSGKPNPGESESGTTLESASKYKSTSVTVSKSTLQQYAGQYIKVYLKTNDSSCDDSSCAAYYYFKLGEVQPTTYTLTYDANGGSGAPSAQSGKATYTISAVTPDMDSYVFLGWATSRYAAEPDYTAGDSITLTKNTTLYAVWAIGFTPGIFLSEHDVTVNVNDFSDTITVTTIPASQTVSVSVESNNIASFGYQVDMNGCSGSILGKQAGSAVLTATMQYGGKTYTDTCTIHVLSSQTYYLTYNANCSDASRVPPGDGGDVTYIITSDQMTRPGYTFLGWATSRTAAAAEYRAGDTITLTQDTTLYAVWKMNEKTLTGITVNTLPNKTTYYVTDSFDPSGLTLIATYSDDSTKTITNGFTCSGFDPEKEGSQTITVTYEGKTTTFAVEVIPVPAVLTRITVDSMPVKTEYKVGETFNSAGLTLTAKYSDDSTKIVTSGFMCSGFDPEKEGLQTITVTYEGKTTTFAVTVISIIPDNTPQMRLSRTSARAGDRVDVTLSVENNPGIIATSVNLSYDTAVLRLVGVENGTLFETKSFSPGKDLDAMPYTIIWEDGLATQNHTENGILATFTFEVLADAPMGTTAITLGYTSSSTFNVDLNEVGFALANGSIEVVDRTPGDVNGDGIVDLKDVVILSRHLSGGWDVKINESNADVNGDHTIDLKDIVILRRYLSGGWNVELK